MPKISVIVPVYNVAEYLRECLDSIINQTLKDIEIICINDGSKDNSIEILSEYAKNDSRITVIDKENQGISIARNEGFEAARGEYVAFMDSDDYLLDMDYFERLLNAAEKYQADIAVVGIIRGNDKKQQVLLEYTHEEVAEEYIDKLKLCDVPDSNYVWNKIYKRESLKATGVVFPEGKMYEDIFYTYQVLYKIGKVVSVPNINYFYRKRPNSIIKKSNKKAMQDCKMAKQQMFDFFKEQNIDVSDFMTEEKKVRLFGQTIYKVITKGNVKENVLFNCLRWKKI